MSSCMANFETDVPMLTLRGGIQKKKNDASNCVNLFIACTPVPDLQKEKKLSKGSSSETVSSTAVEAAAIGGDFQMPGNAKHTQLKILRLFCFTKVRSRN